MNSLLTFENLEISPTLLDFCFLEQWGGLSWWGLCSCTVRATWSWVLSDRRPKS
jgi:hypothetical protein